MSTDFPFTPAQRHITYVILTFFFVLYLMMLRFFFFLFFSVFVFLKLEIFVVGYSEKKKKNPLTANMSEDNIVFLGGMKPFLKYSSDCIMFWVMQHRFVKKKKAPWGKKYNIINDFWWLWIQIDSSSPIRTPDGRNDQIKNLEKKKVKSCLLVATRRSVRQELRQQATFLFVQLFHKINPPLRGLYCSLPPASSPQQDHQKKKNTTLFSRSPRITRLYSGNGTLELERIYMNI